MGYTTEFKGRFKFNKPLDSETLTFLTKLANTRRMARNLPPEYGTEGEFYVDGGGFAGQDREPSVIDFNRPPSTQPSLWLQWEPTQDGKYLEWNGAEKFYSYVEWLEYLIEKVLAPKGYSISGRVMYQGEDDTDAGMIEVRQNRVHVQSLDSYVTYFKEGEGE